MAERMDSRDRSGSKMTAAGEIAWRLLSIAMVGACGAILLLTLFVKGTRASA